MARLVTMLILVFAVHLSYSLKCYVCKSNCYEFEKEELEIETCNEPVDDEHKEYCLTAVGKMITTGEWSAYRYCSDMLPSEDPNGGLTCRYDHEQFTSVTCYRCEEDLCNSASSMGFHIFLAVAAVFVFIALWY